MDANLPEFSETSENQVALHAAPETVSSTDAPKISKNALKRMRKQQEWEDGAEDRRKKRKERRIEARDRKKETRDALLAQGVDPASLRRKKEPSTIVPLSLVLDCDFEKYMNDKELHSLGSQITRSYSENKNARYKTHIFIAGWQGKLKQRFETALRNSQVNWKGVGFCEGNFIEAAAQARERMRERGGDMNEPLQRSLDNPTTWVRDENDPLPLPDPEPEPKEEHRDMVYLTSDSPYTLERLEPNTSYVIGGIVDKNREKGLCYRRARELGIRTARLPIGEFMIMQARKVLATNHVVEIMLKWLECGDWGEAFTTVIPKRKGGFLRSGEEDEENQEENNENVNKGDDEEMAQEPVAVEAVKAES